MKTTMKTERNLVVRLREDCFGDRCAERIEAANEIERLQALLLRDIPANVLENEFRAAFEAGMKYMAGRSSAYFLLWWLEGRERVAALLRAKPVGEPRWQPIETAPKDGTRILAYQPATTFSNGEPYPAVVDVTAWWTGDNLNRPRWGMCGTIWKPTYWMPLPAAPQEQDGGEYRQLEAGEIVREGDEYDAAAGWNDPPDWRPAKNWGMRAMDPNYPAHTRYRRRVPTVSAAGGEEPHGSEWKIPTAPPADNCPYRRAEFAFNDERGEWEMVRWLDAEPATPEQDGEKWLDDLLERYHKAASVFDDPPEHAGDPCESAEYKIHVVRKALLAALRRPGEQDVEGLVERMWQLGGLLAERDMLDESLECGMIANELLKLAALRARSQKEEE